MTRPIRIVSPYRPFAPESPAHRLLGPFDWVAALTMLHASAARQAYAFAAITDRETALPTPSIPLPTTSTRLMLWILEVSLRYLESDAFDVDTVLVSPDSLVMGDVRPYFAGDLSILVRSHSRYAKRPILNAVQWWPVASKAKLIGFYRETLARAEQLPPNLICWGADSESIRIMIAPIALGLQDRHGLRVSMIEARSVMGSLTSSDLLRLRDRQPVVPTTPVVDFKYLRKLSMRAYFDAVMPTVGAR